MFKSCRSGPRDLVFSPTDSARVSSLGDGRNVERLTSLKMSASTRSMMLDEADFSVRVEYPSEDAHKHLEM